MQALAQVLARIRVRGTVQRRTNGSVEVWVEFKYRNNRSAAIDMVILPENSLEEIDEVFIRPVARELALKLLIAIGRVPHLGSNWTTLDAYLRGLEASTQRNWWQAIAYYREALQAEESAQGSFGIGHFHLGAALVYQGSWREGYEHLQIAEADGPPLAEMQYMLALTLLYNHWGELHTNPNVFQEICERCQKAIRLRADFAEAYQLLGTAYYRHARNIDREATVFRPKKGPIANSDPQTAGENASAGDTRRNASTERENSTLSKEDRVRLSQNYYHLALHNFRRALQHYDRMYRRRNYVPDTYGVAEEQRNRMVQQRMTVTHEIGDALRALSLYPEAEGYYDDVSLIFPRLTRNLADRTKSLCMAQDWEHVEESLWRDVMKDNISRWDADIAIHVGWALSGGVYQRFGPFFDARFHLIRRGNHLWHKLVAFSYANTTVRQPYDRRPNTLKLAYELVGEAMAHYDFALHQRPRYMEAWRQTDWLNAYARAIAVLQCWQAQQSSKANVPDAELIDTAISTTTDIYQCNAEGNFTQKGIFREPIIEWYQLWIALRIGGYFDRKTVDDYRPAPPWNQLCVRFFEQLKQSKHELTAQPAEDGKIFGEFNREPKAGKPNFRGQLTFEIPDGNGGQKKSVKVVFTGTFTAEEKQTESNPSQQPAAAPTTDRGTQIISGRISGIRLAIKTADVSADKANDATQTPQRIFEGTVSDANGVKIGTIKGVVERPSYEEFIDHYQQLFYQRTLIADAEAEAEADRRRQKIVPPLENSFRQLDTAQCLYQRWQKVDASFRKLGQVSYEPSESPSQSLNALRKEKVPLPVELCPDGLMTFAGRWAIDIYQEWTLLTCRSLAQAGANEMLFAVAERAQEICEAWMVKWRATYANTGDEGDIKPHATFSPYVNRFQRATILAWLAYAKLQCCFDRLSLMRKVELSGTNTLGTLREKPKADALAEIQKHVTEARRLVPYHPLAMWVQAQVFRRDRLESQAIEELERLLDVVAPFDPKQDIGGNVFATDAPNPTTSAERTNLYNLERVCGRQQFHQIINAAALHTLLSDCYIAANKPNLSAFHLMEAVRWAAYSDSSAAVSISFRLANQLNSMERYAEAEAVLEAMRDHRQQMVPGQLADHDVDAADILLSVINTRRMYYAESLETGKRVAHHFRFAALPEAAKKAATTIVTVPKCSDLSAAKKSATTIVNVPKCGDLSAAKKSADEKSVEIRYKAAHQQAVDSMREAVSALNPTVRKTAKKSKNPQDNSGTLAESRKKLHNALELAHTFAKVDTPAGLAHRSNRLNFTKLVALAVTAHTTEAKGATGNSADTPFPGVFVNIVENWKQERETLETAATLAYCWGADEGLKYLANHSMGATGDADQRAFNTIFYSHVVAHYSRRAWNSLTQFGELCNSLAYNRAETGIGLNEEKYALIDAHCASAVMAFLFESAGTDTPQRHEAAEILAQICDTFGWVHYRRSFPAARDTLDPKQRGGAKWLSDTHANFAMAEKFLLKGIRLDAKRAIIHYHLARTYLSCVEALWQSNPNQVSDVAIGEVAHKIDNFLTQALREWRNAAQYDQFKRLHYRLTWLYNRISSYKRAWEKRQLAGIAGRIENTSWSSGYTAD